MLKFIWYWTKIGFCVLFGAVLFWMLYEFLTFPNLEKLRKEDPTTTSMIEFRLNEARADGKEPKKYMIWMPIERISPNLAKAVLAGEDSRFIEHHGFDWDAIENAWNEAQKEAEKEAKSEGDNDENDWIPTLPSFKRGASTITQQLVKNLYLSEERSFLRKGREAVITYFIERTLDKKRILEIYLNVIEWGDGVYGAEAASRYYFKKSAADLSPNEAAYLSAMIPSPLNVFNPKKNPKRLARRQKIILRGIPFVKLPPGV